MTLTELGEKIREFLPEAEILHDDDGQLVIYTNKWLHDNMVVDQEEPEDYDHRLSEQ